MDLLAIKTATDIHLWSEFLTGTPSEAEDLKQVQNLSGYVHYLNLLKTHWNSFEKSNLTPLRNFSRDKIHKISTHIYKKVIYPFSGPDFANVNAVFPSAEEYILFGLEKLQPLPGFNHFLQAYVMEIATDPGKVSERLSSELLPVVSSLSHFCNYNFFKTNQMYDEFTGHKKKALINGLVTQLLLQIASSGYHIESLRYLSLSKAGKLAYLITPQQSLNAIEILIKNKEPGSKRQRVIYLNVDVADSRFMRKNPGVFKYLTEFENTAIFIKAASYLLQLKNYSYIKKILLSQADFIVMDDSGFSFHDIKDKFDIQLFGRYTKVDPIFKNHFDPQWQHAFMENSKSDLTFRFGYVNEPRLILLKRKH